MIYDRPDGRGRFVYSYRTKLDVRRWVDGFRFQLCWSSGIVEKSFWMQKYGSPELRPTIFAEWGNRLKKEGIKGYLTQMSYGNHDIPDGVSCTG